MTLEISPQHHSVVLGKNSNNLKQIMQQTSTQIMFPDAGDPNIPNLKKSNICITGTIHNVYLARQQLMVCAHFISCCTELLSLLSFCV
jgi:protein bicaudal C